LAALCCAFIPAIHNALAMPRPDAVVTRVVGNATVGAAAGGSHTLRVGDRVRIGDALRTGVDSRLEVTFPDEAIARLGAETSIVSKNGSRNLILDGGVLFVDAPRKAHVAIRAGGYAASISASTMLFEFRPDVYKFMVIDGTSRLYRPAHFGDSVLVRAGQLVIGDPAQPVSDPVDFEIARFIKTSCFIADFAPLPNAKSLVSAGGQQEQRKTKKRLVGTNLVIFGGGSFVSIIPPAASETTAAAQPADDLGTVQLLPARLDKSNSPSGTSTGTESETLSAQ
jgi:hypothetical protein